MCWSSQVKSFIFFIVACQFALAIKQDHVLYNMKRSTGIKQTFCDTHSPEIFFHDVALPSLSGVYLRSQAFFGILMDQIEASAIDDGLEESKNKTEEQMKFITNTVGNSLDSAIDRVETSWRFFIVAYETHPLPWEMQYKFIVLSEALNRLEYNYMMIEAVIRSGTKEIVGMLQQQLTKVIRQLDDEMSKSSESKSEPGEKIFKQMKRALNKMKPSFATKLLEKVMTRAIDKFKSSHGTNHVQANTKQTTFVSEAMDQMAILFHAYREKGSVYQNFWHDLSKIFVEEFKISDEDDKEVVSAFINDMSNQNVLIELAVQFISRDS